MYSASSVELLDLSFFFVLLPCLNQLNVCALACNYSVCEDGPHVAKAIEFPAY